MMTESLEHLDRFYLSGPATPMSQAEKDEYKAWKEDYARRRLEADGTVMLYRRTTEERLDLLATQVGMLQVQVNKLTEKVTPKPTSSSETIEEHAEIVKKGINKGERGNDRSYEAHASADWLVTLAKRYKAELEAQAEMAVQSVQKMRDLYANWRQIIEEQDPDGGPLIENILYWLIEDNDPSHLHSVLREETDDD